MSHPSSDPVTRSGVQWLRRLPFLFSTRFNEVCLRITEGSFRSVGLPAICVIVFSIAICQLHAQTDALTSHEKSDIDQIIAPVLEIVSKKQQLTAEKISQYVAYLVQLESVVAKGGDLDAAMRVRVEREIYQRGESTPGFDAEGKDSLEKVSSVRTKLDEQLQTLEEQAAKALSREKTKAISALDQMKIKITKSGRLQAAMVVSQRIEELQNGTLSSLQLPIVPLRDATIEAASKENPLTNSLGMKFVPVNDTDVLFCIHETRWRDYAEFAKANPGIAMHWRNQTFEEFPVENRPEDHPVVNVTWQESVDFCRWLSEKEQRTYRLPTDKEWSVAVGLGRKEKWRRDDTPRSVLKDQSEFPWGGNWPPPTGAGNYSDASRRNFAKVTRGASEFIDGYDDGFPTTAPVMSFKPNQFGIYDMGGNAMEWVGDWMDSSKTEHVLRDRGWVHAAQGALLSSARMAATDHRDDYFGFRIVLEP